MKIITECKAEITPEDWFDRGKEDAWLGQTKQAPDHDPEAASLYDLGYSEGKIQRSPQWVHKLP